MPWAKLPPPERPKIAWKTTDQKPMLHIGGGEGVRWFVVRSRQDKQWTVRIVEGHGAEVRVPFAQRPAAVVVTAVDRAGNESAAATE